MIGSQTRLEIAARIRGLIAGQDRGDIAETARRLGVDELSLRMSIDDTSPYPTVDVLSALVSSYGVDPTYLLTGTYDAHTHRRVLDDPTVAADSIRELARSGKPSRPLSDPPDEKPRLHLA
jgi:hypothetical protein